MSGAFAAQATSRGSTIASKPKGRGLRGWWLIRIGGDNLEVDTLAQRQDSVVGAEAPMLTSPFGLDSQALFQLVAGCIKVRNTVCQMVKHWNLSRPP